MLKFLKSNWIILSCFAIWAIIAYLQVLDKHPYRGLVGNIILASGIIISFIRRKKDYKKFPLNSPSKKQHVLNWVILILAIILIIIITSYILLNKA